MTLFEAQMDSFLSVLPGKMTRMTFGAPAAYFIQPGLDYLNSRGGS